MIVDAQVHLWDEDRPDRPWPEGTSSAGHRRITTDEVVAEMDAAGVDRAVLVPPSWEGERNDVVLAAAQAHPERFAVMGRIPSDLDAEALARWTAQPRMAGVRITCHRGPQRAWLTGREGDWMWDAASTAGLPVMLYAPGMNDEVEQLVSRFPDLRIAVDHVNLALSVTADQLLDNVERVLPLARFDNVVVKASGMECHVAGGDRLALIGEAVRRLLAAFGAERVFWGTDLTRVPCSYREAATVIDDALPELDERDRELVMGEAILRWLPWPA